MGVDILVAVGVFVPLVVSSDSYTALVHIALLV